MGPPPVPLVFADPADYDRIAPGDVLAIDGVRDALRQPRLMLRNSGRDESYEAVNDLSERYVRMLLAGGLISELRGRARSVR